MTSEFIGWDIGGAHLKAACVKQNVLSSIVQVSCPLWKGNDELNKAWKSNETVLSAGEKTEHVVTMTGELADCFLDRKDGVEKIITTVAQHLQKDFKVYAGNSGFLDANDAVSHADKVASANWHATAAYLGKSIGAGVLIDIGSTTTDIVPFNPMGATTCAESDYNRLCAGELVYTGVVRTPVMALADAVQVNGESFPLVAEFFATTADVYRVLGQLIEETDQYPTCDGSTKTPAASARRLARMFGCDLGDADDWTVHAHALAKCQMHKIKSAYTKVLHAGQIDSDTPIVGAGAGRFLACDLAHHIGQPYIDFADLFETVHSDDVRLVGDCASAVSVALLMCEMR